ncbi:MAG: helix-turn-helix domain-containing protein [Acidobacteriota bacterium]|nr:helix-turn-helix domain-containing protein [Acidobacteriota bacterium]
MEQIADQTKISIGFLRAIEAEEFDKLPGGLFATSYIRQYAACAGVDASDLLSQYSLKTAVPEDAPIPRKQPGSETRAWFGRWLGIAADTPR